MRTEPLKAGLDAGGHALIFGGAAPAFNAWLISLTGNPIAPACGVMVAWRVGMVALTFILETA
jgi:MHS family proline/betaine transporter-like MFS transporter